MVPHHFQEDKTKSSVYHSKSKDPLTVSHLEEVFHCPERKIMILVWLEENDHLIKREGEAHFIPHHPTLSITSI